MHVEKTSVSKIVYQCMTKHTIKPYIHTEYTEKLTCFLCLVWSIGGWWFANDPEYFSHIMNQYVQVKLLDIGRSF